MECKSYEFKWYWMDSEKKPLYFYYVEIFSNTTPATLPVDATNLVGFPKEHPADRVRFVAGSCLFAISEGRVFIADENHEFVEGE